MEDVDGDGAFDMVLQLKTKRSVARMIRDDVKQAPGYVQAQNIVGPGKALRK